jgi:hypothetical protein
LSKVLSVYSLSPQRGERVRVRGEKRTFGKQSISSHPYPPPSRGREKAGEFMKLYLGSNTKSGCKTGRLILKEDLKGALITPLCKGGQGGFI